MILGYVEEEYFVVEGSVVGDVGGRRWAYGENRERSNPVEGNLGLEHGGVGVFLGPLADSGRVVVDPCPAAHGARVKSEGRP